MAFLFESFRPGICYYSQKHAFKFLVLKHLDAHAILYISEPLRIAFFINIVLVYDSNLTSFICKICGL